MLTCKFTGNLGNKLFELWSLVGIARRHQQQVVFPESEIYQDLKGWFPIGEVVGSEQKEQAFTYHEWKVKSGDHILTGYRQTEKYWGEVESELRAMFEFKDQFKGICREKLPGLFDKAVICISIRRGDFVNNPVYFQIPTLYYISALLKYFPDYEDYNLLFLSDDISYCRVHFECLPNAFFADACNAMEQLCLGSMADHHIISNSTFSWWCAYLANADKVIRPEFNFGVEYRQAHPEHDYWPNRPNWIVHKPEKINLLDTTFMIPVFHDHQDRKQNLNLTVCMLQRDFDTNITIMEQGSDAFGYMQQWCRFMKFDSQYFHRTRMLNQMALSTGTPYVVNWDADVFIPPMQIIRSIQLLRKGKDFVYPYDGRFARVLRRPWFRNLETFLDTGIFGDITHFGKGGKPMAVSSVGGAVCMRRDAFIESGMENEKMISYAPEDCERWDRWHQLGYQVERVKGKLFHMDHWIGPDSCSKNKFFKANHDELDKIREMDKDKLRKYVDTWPWYQAVISQAR